MSGWLVWLRGIRGPRAEIWRDNLDVYRDRSEAQILTQRELSDAEVCEPLDGLANKYPLNSAPED